jgi:hypothetical protein
LRNVHCPTAPYPLPKRRRFGGRYSPYGQETCMCHFTPCSRHCPLTAT